MNIDIPLLWAVLLPVAASLPGYGNAQQYPVKPVRVIVPFAPGGGADISARLLTNKMSEEYGHSFIVDNRGGGGGIIGMELAAKAPPDGYTLMVTGSFSGAAAVYRPAFDPMNSIVQIGEVGYTPFVLAIHPSVPAKTTSGLFALARAKPNSLAYASTGTGGLTHLATELMSNMANIKMIHVPYKSTGLSMSELLAGQCQLILGSILPTLPHLKSGKLRPLAVTTAKPWHSLPDIPTINDTLPGYDVKVAFGMMGPKGLPPGVVDRLNRSINMMLQDENVRKSIEGLGMAPSGGTARQFTEFTRKDYDRWVKVVDQIGIKAE